MATFQSGNITMTLAGNVLTADAVVGVGNANVRISHQYTLEDPNKTDCQDTAGTSAVCDLEAACHQRDFDALGIVSKEVPVSTATQELYIRVLMAALKFYTW